VFKKIFITSRTSCKAQAIYLFGKSGGRKENAWDKDGLCYRLRCMNENLERVEGEKKMCGTKTGFATD
jgi:hypothetical protein